jgi:predicted nucleic acid-binding protein
MRIVVDTNIAFSGILNTNSKISRIILHPKSRLNFYSTNELENELSEHWDKLKKISKYADTDLHKAASLIISRIRFINVGLIPQKVFMKAEELAADIDIDDTEFIALAEHLRGKLWTGDKQLVKGLKKKNWNHTISTDELFKAVIKIKSLKQGY